MMSSGLLREARAEKARPVVSVGNCVKLSWICYLGYLRLIIKEIKAPAVKPAANVVATISIG